MNNILSCEVETNGFHCLSFLSSLTWYSMLEEDDR